MTIARRSQYHGIALEIIMYSSGIRALSGAVRFTITGVRRQTILESQFCRPIYTRNATIDASKHSFDEDYAHSNGFEPLKIAAGVVIVGSAAAVSYLAYQVLHGKSQYYTLLDTIRHDDIQLYDVEEPYRRISGLQAAAFRGLTVEKLLLQSAIVRACAPQAWVVREACGILSRELDIRLATMYVGLQHDDFKNVVHVGMATLGNLAQQSKEMAQVHGISTAIMDAALREMFVWRRVAIISDWVATAQMTSKDIQPSTVQTPSFAAIHAWASQYRSLQLTPFQVSSLVHSTPDGCRRIVNVDANAAAACLTGETKQLLENAAVASCLGSDSDNEMRYMPRGGILRADLLAAASEASLMQCLVGEEHPGGIPAILEVLPGKVHIIDREAFVRDAMSNAECRDLSQASLFSVPIDSIAQLWKPAAAMAPTTTAAGEEEPSEHHVPSDVSAVPEGVQMLHKLVSARLEHMPPAGSNVLVHAELGATMLLLSALPAFLLYVWQKHHMMPLEYVKSLDETSQMHLEKACLEAWSAVVGPLTAAQLNPAFADHVSIPPPTVSAQVLDDIRSSVRSILPATLHSIRAKAEQPQAALAVLFADKGFADFLRRSCHNALVARGVASSESNAMFTLMQMLSQGVLADANTFHAYMAMMDDVFRAAFGHV